MERMKLSAECTSTSLDDEDHLVITIDVLTESILADPRRSGRLSGSSGLEGPRSTAVSMGRRNTRVKPRRLGLWLQSPAEPTGKLAQRWFPVTWPIPR
jgi:hypothetical protein